MEDMDGDPKAYGAILLETSTLAFVGRVTPNLVVG
jgi:hypothetical protein